MAITAFPYTSFSGTILSSQVMANYNHLRDHYNSNAVETSGNQTIAGVKTFSGVPVFSSGATITTGGLTVTAGGATITAGDVAVTAGNLTFGAASARIIPGATSLLFRDTANANTNVTITDAGAVTVRAGLTVSSGTTTVGALTSGAITATGNSTITGTLGGITTLTATTLAGTLSTASQTNVTAVGTLTSLTVSGNVTLSGATNKVLIGGTSTTFRNAADTTDRIVLRDSSSNPVTVGATTNGLDIGGASVTLRSTGGAVYLGPDTTPTLFSTSATTGFPVMPMCAGAPSGTLSSALAGAFVFDSNNAKLCIWNGTAWKTSAAFT